MFIWSVCFIALPKCYALNIEFKPDSGLFKLERGNRYSNRYCLCRLDKGVEMGLSYSQSRLDGGGREQFFTLRFAKQGASSQVALSANANSIQYRYSIEFEKTTSDTIGSGIEFKLDQASQRLQEGSGKPYLLENNKGWGWEIAPGKTILVFFSQGVSSVYFERNNPYRIRAMFFKDRLFPGMKQVVMEVRLPEGTTVAKVNKIYAREESANWLEGALMADRSFIDLSWLNEKPAGQHGFVRAEGDKFVFDDGLEARFFGVNIQAYSLFIRNKNLIRAHAQRLASLGVNLVRLHHHDSAIWVNNCLIEDGETTQKFNEQALDSYFWWVKCLRDEGIYLWIDLQVERPWREGDNIPGWDTDLASKLRRGMTVSKGFVYLNERMQSLTKQFNETLLTRINPYTELALKDDPAVMGVLITNENDLTHHFGNTFLADKGHSYHQKLFEDEVDKFSLKHNVPVSKLKRTWEEGPSKLLLNDLEARFNREMLEHLRALGVKVPIATTNLWGGNSLFSLPALTIGDMIDTHAYADDTILHKNPRYSANLIHWIGQGQVANMPLTVSEYNIAENELVNREGFVTVPYIAAMAAFQGWDATMLYGYSQDGFGGKTFSPWSSYINPAITGLIPAAAMMYREAHVMPASETIVVKPGSESLYNKKTSPHNSATLRTLIEQHRMLIAIPETEELPWLEPTDMSETENIMSDLNIDTLPDKQNYVISDTGELFRDWEKGILTINTPKSQGATGEVGSERIILTDAVLDIRTPRATVMLTSLDGQDLKYSKEILLSTAARVRGIKMGEKNLIQSEIVSGQIELFSDFKDLNVWSLLSDGRRGQAIPIRNEGDKSHIIDLPVDAKTHWFLITN